MSVLLAPVLEADLSRPWAEDLVATDVSPAFGFEVSTLHAGAARVRELGRRALKPAALVTTSVVLTPEEAKVRMGNPSSCLTVKVGLSRGAVSAEDL